MNGAGGSDLFRLFYYGSAKYYAERRRLYKRKVTCHVSVKTTIVSFICFFLFKEEKKP
jgi:hypothetical protein